MLKNAEKLSGSGSNFNTPAITAKVPNDGTKTEKSDGPEDLLDENGAGQGLNSGAQDPSQTGAAKPSLGGDVLHESYVAAGQ